MSKRKNLTDIIYGDRATARYSKPEAKTFGGPVVDFGDYSWSSKDLHGCKPRCYTTHPPLKLPGSDLVIYGGSCSSPVVQDADVYIGFDQSMTFTSRSWPWKKGAEFLFRITDMSVPDKPEEFARLVAWTREQLEAGKKVHCGCIGGHGRTGTFLAALVSTYGEADAIAYVRDGYCKKAVESTPQVEYLHKHFGVKKAKETKTYSYTTSSKTKSSKGKAGGKRSRIYEPIKGMGSVWG